MITLRPLTPRAVEVIVEGDVTPAEVGRAFAELDSYLDETDRIDIYAEVGKDVQFGFRSIFEEFRHFSTMMRLIRSLGRVAIVADQRGIKETAKVEGKLIPGAHYEVYPLREARQARQWLLRHTDMAHAA